MSDFPQAQDYAPTVISSFSKQSLGFYQGLAAATSLGVYPLANSAILIPLVIAMPTLIAKVFWQNGATVSGNVDVGIYDSQGNKIVSTGSTAQAGTSAIQNVDTTDVVIRQGVYYMAMACDNTTGTFRNSATSSQSGRMFGVYQVTSSFPLPTTITFAAPTSNYIPFIGLTGATVI